ncbi:death effector domain-containing 1 isoform X2 [Cynoglossus semilaevis]|uniref:death effector domain-containing 1 isoform X2 n=1 Tax=Cynoglossus semilaevis TaxID=244447 RepID=UPI0004967682|nr:DNA-binding death effector domain-containing protein 2 isoform X2 [Cynoglossus semilaevis]
MAALRHRGCPQRNRPCWDEAACVTHYGMMSLHEVFETVGSQLTETEIELLSFLLNELCPSAHPLDPAGWTVDYHKEDSESSAVSPSPQLLKAWRHLKPRASQLPFVAPFQPKSGLELLLELERRGYLSDGNLEPLLQLLRVLTRHDLLPLVSHKKRRTVSPERTGGRCGPNSRGGGCASGGRQTELPLPFYTQQLRSSIHVPGPHVRRRRRKRGNGWSRRPKKSSKQKQQLPPPTPPPHKKSCKSENLKVKGQRTLTKEKKTKCHGINEAFEWERDGVLLQQQSSAAGFHSKFWNNDMGTFSAVFLLSTMSACVCGPSTWSTSRLSATASPRTSSSRSSASLSCSARPALCCVPETWVPWCVTSSSQNWRTWRLSGATT